METNLNSDLVRKTKAALCYSSGSKFVISPKIEQLITANRKTAEKIKANEANKTKTKSGVVKHSHKKEQKKETKTETICAEYTWLVETIDSADDAVDESLKEQKHALKQIFKNNGAYGPIKAIGLEPTFNELPTLICEQSMRCKLDYARLPSMNYLIANYIDLSNVFYIRLLLKYFDCSSDDKISSKLLRKYLAKHPKAFKHAFIGSTVNNSNTESVRCTLQMQIHFKQKSEHKQVVFGLNEFKRHKLLCTLLRIKHRHKRQASKGRHCWNAPLCIPQPPPPPPHSTNGKNNNERLAQMNAVCVNYNWNGQCDAKYCHKKHECVSCGERHPARICSKECIDFNWAKCENRHCMKQHQCSQCGDRQHAAWKCKYLHKIVAERYYFIYKAKKLKNGYFENQTMKQMKKNKEWIERKKAKYAQSNGATVALQSNLNHFNKNLSNLQQSNVGTRDKRMSVRRYSYPNTTNAAHYQQHNKTKKRALRK